MSKILISFSCPVFENGLSKIGLFYEGLINALEDEGNEICVINTVDFLSQSWNSENNKLPFYINKQKVIKKIKDFKPDLVFAFNHSIPVEVEEVCDCKIVLFDSDSLNFFSDKGYMKRNLEKYIFFCYTKLGVRNAIKFGADKNKVHHILAATNIKSEEKEIKRNISFIGTQFLVGEQFIELLQTEKIKKIRKLADSLIGRFYEDNDEIFKNCGIENLLDKVPMNDFLSLTSVQDRITVLNNLQDLGLEIWGPDIWIYVAKILPWLGMCYNKNIVYSLKHNQDIYNSSKLCVSIAHSQTVDGFPFRIMDIMASNGCLVSDYHSGLELMTKNYIDLPMYDNPYDARELCKKLLSDDIWRNEIVQA